MLLPIRQCQSQLTVLSSPDNIGVDLSFSFTYLLASFFEIPSSQIRTVAGYEYFFFHLSCRVNKPCRTGSVTAIPCEAGWKCVVATKIEARNSSFLFQFDEFRLQKTNENKKELLLDIFFFKLLKQFLKILILFYLKNYNQYYYHLY